MNKQERAMETRQNADISPLEALSEIYRLYDDYTETFSLACRKYCSDCCTADVTLTSLEAEMIYRSLDRENQRKVFEKVAACSDAPRFRPSMTTNSHARICSEHREPPKETFPEQPGVCPLLEGDACTIYPVRPFGCRCMISSKPCRRTGSAQIDDITLTVNTMFLQIIEHADRQGFSGNLTDVLTRLGPGGEKTDAAGPTVSNEPVTVLMVPPEHHSRVIPLLNTLNHILGRVPAFS
ncbi:MAG: YkgJ family cysteine cluster protein [Desulfobacterales bacterium]